MTGSEIGKPRMTLIRFRDPPRPRAFENTASSAPTEPAVGQGLAARSTQANRFFVCVRL